MDGVKGRPWRGEVRIDTRFLLEEARRTGNRLDPAFASLPLRF